MQDLACIAGVDMSLIIFASLTNLTTGEQIPIAPNATCNTVPYTGSCPVLTSVTATQCKLAVNLLSLDLDHYDVLQPFYPAK